MESIATSEFLAHLKSLYPHAKGSVVESSWYLYAAVAFSASNVPEAVPFVFRYVLEELKREGSRFAHDTQKAQLLLARRMRECVFRAGMLSGYARAINSLVSLHGVMPEELKDTHTLRDTDKTMSEYSDHGRALFRAMYAETADNVQGLLDAIHPDMGWFSNTIAYGVVYGGPDQLSQVEVSLIMAVTNIVMDTPKQAGWHLNNAGNGGASAQEVDAARKIATEVASRCGVSMRKVP